MICGRVTLAFANRATSKYAYFLESLYEKNSILAFSLTVGAVFCNASGDPNRHWSDAYALASNKYITVLVEGPVTAADHHPQTWAWISGVYQEIVDYPDCGPYPINIDDAQGGTWAAEVSNGVGQCIGVMGLAAVGAAGTYETDCWMRVKVCSGGVHVEHYQEGDPPDCGPWAADNHGDGAAGLSPGLSWTIAPYSGNPVTITITAASSLMSAIGGNDVCIDESQYGPCDVVEASGGPAFHFVLSGPGGSDLTQIPLT